MPGPSIIARFASLPHGVGVRAFVRRSTARFASLPRDVGARAFVCQSTLLGLALALLVLFMPHLAWATVAVPMCQPSAASIATAPAEAQTLTHELRPWHECADNPRATCEPDEHPRDSAPQNPPIRIPDFLFSASFLSTWLGRRLVLTISPRADSVVFLELATEVFRPPKAPRTEPSQPHPHRCPPPRAVAEVAAMVA